MKRNIVICIVAIVLGALSFVATNSAAALALAGVAIIAPLASMAFGRITAERTRIEFAFQQACTAGQPLDLAITVTRPALSRNRINLTFRFRNLLTGVVEEAPVTLAPASGKVEHFHLPLNTTCCGRVEVSLIAATATDSLGFLDAPIEGLSLESSYTVYPQVSDIIAQTTRANRSSISGTTYDYHRKGQDRTEVFDLREFQEGDSLKTVHWKLSARFDDLMVREPSRPTDYDVTILCDAHELNETGRDATVLNGVLSVAASISLSLVQQGLSHSVAYQSASANALESNFVDNRDSFNTMLDVLVANPLPAEASDDVSAFDEFRRAHNVTRTVLVTDTLDEAMAEKLSELTDLSVFHIGQGTQAGADTSSGYALTFIPAEAVGERIKNLEL